MPDNRILLLTIAIIFLVLGGIACLLVLFIGGSQDIAIAKSAIRKGKDIDDFDVTGRKHEDKIRKLLAKNNYTYQRIDLEPKTRKVAGLGKIEYADGTIQYQLFYSENWYTIIDKEKYDELQSHIGQEIIVNAYSMMWRKNNV